MKHNLEDKMKYNKTAQQIINLIEHILAMQDDSYLTGHPEWLEIVNEAQQIKGDA